MDCIDIFMGLVYSFFLFVGARAIYFYRQRRKAKT